MTFPVLSKEERLRLLALPSGPADVVMDTDTYNEIDDQFAVVYALLSPKLRVHAFYAAPFFNDNSIGPADGMERSYQELLTIMGRMGDKAQGEVLRGSTNYMPDKQTPVDSPAAQDLIARARAQTDGPLYVLTIGAITNVASAIVMAPDIIKKIVIVWLGGHPIYWPHTREFNLRQDIPASQLIFDCGVPLVQLTCANVTEQLRTTLPEVERFVKGRGAIGEYLYETYRFCREDHFGYSRVIWDISAVAYMNNPDWIQTRLAPSPVLQEDVTWGETDPSRHLIRSAYHVDRDAIFGDLFRRLEANA